MKETTNFGLKKPEANDFYDFETQNENLDEIDRVLQEYKEGTQPVGDSAKLGGKALNDIVQQDSKSVYVSPSGSDENGDGTQENPWRTIQKAVNECPAIADNNSMYIIYLADGVYTENLDVRRKVFRLQSIDTANADITLKGNMYVRHGSYVEIRTPMTIDTENTQYHALNSTDGGRLSILSPITVKNATSCGLVASGQSSIFANAKVTVDGCRYAISAETASIVACGVCEIKNSTEGLCTKGGILAYHSVSFENVTTQYVTSYGGRMYTGAQTSVGKY